MNIDGNNKESLYERTYTVYMHTSPSGKRYIGITSMKPKVRWNNGYGYQNQIFYRAIKKYGWNNIKHDILFENLTKQEAEQKEIELIAYYKSDDYHYGYNVEHGGNSTGKMSEEQKRKLIKIHTGRRCTEETKRRMSESGKNKVFSEEHRKHLSKSKMNKYHTEETKQKISKNRKDKNGVIQYSKNGDFISEYDSVCEASRVSGIVRQNIISCCKKYRKSAGGYIWRYLNEEYREAI